MNAIQTLISIAKAEVGYLEKESEFGLYDKIKNAGDENYTKYWKDIMPSWNGSYWCAIFVTWCFLKTFGEEKAKALLRHYPYVYCPALVGRFPLHSHPQIGDIVIFQRNGEFVHTGIVTYVKGDYFKTIEGNTNGGDGIADNGGGVFEKSYYNSKLPGTKFVRPDYEIVESEEPMTSEEKAKFNELVEVVARLSEKVEKLSNPTIYNYVDKNMPEWARPTVQKLIDKGALKGNENGLNLSNEDLRLLVINDRLGLYN